MRALFRWPHRSRLASAARLPDAGRFDPEFSTRQPLFTVSDWAREPALQCKADGRKRVPLVTAEISQTAAIKVQMALYPPGTKSASYRHEGAESFIYLLSGRGTAGTHDQSSSVRKGDLIWFRDSEWHHLEAAADSGMRFVILYAPGVFRTTWEDPSKASAWSPTGLDVNGFETAATNENVIASASMPSMPSLPITLGRGGSALKIRWQS